VGTKGDPSDCGEIWVEGAVSLATGEFTAVCPGTAPVEAVASGTSKCPPCRELVGEGEIDGVGVEIAVAVATGAVAPPADCSDVGVADGDVSDAASACSFGQKTRAAGIKAKVTKSVLIVWIRPLSRLIIQGAGDGVGVGVCPEARVKMTVSIAPLRSR